MPHIILLITLALWFAGWIVLGRIRRCGRGESNQPVSAEQLSIIIPARNEEHNLPTLLRSLAAQSIRAREVIVVDDASTDRTAEIAQQHGARVINSQPLPDGWRGKTWACHQGAQTATGEHLLFLDSDTWFETEGLRRVLAEFKQAGGGVLSVAPHHAVRDFHEQLSAFFNLVMLAGTGAFTLRGDHLPPRGLLGQFMLIERSAYNRVGGHEAVKGRILENFWLAEQLRAAGVPLRCRSGRGVFRVSHVSNGLARTGGRLDKRLCVRRGTNPAADSVARRRVDDWADDRAARTGLCRTTTALGWGLRAVRRASRVVAALRRHVSLEHGVVLSRAVDFLFRGIHALGSSITQQTNRGLEREAD